MIAQLKFKEFNAMATNIDDVTGFTVIPNREDGEATFATDADTTVTE